MLKKITNTNPFTLNGWYYHGLKYNEINTETELAEFYHEALDSTEMTEDKDFESIIYALISYSTGISCESVKILL